MNFATDTDTGVWSAAADHVSVATGGIERATIDDGHFYLNGDSDTYFYHSGPDQLIWSTATAKHSRLMLITMSVWVVTSYHLYQRVGDSSFCRC